MYPKYKDVGGPVSFQAKFVKGMAARGIEVSYDLEDPSYDVLLVIGGLRNFRKLKLISKNNIPIVQRLDGINWIHKQTKTGLKHFIKSEYSNLIISYLRNKVVNKIIYQSDFVLKRWEKIYGPTKVPHSVVHNGVDLDQYTPDGPHDRPESPYKIALVEGSFGGGYEFGLVNTVKLIETLRDSHGINVEVHIAGNVSDTVRNYWNQKTTIPIVWAGILSAGEIPQFNRSAHLLFSTDLNPACPNSVIEALACGLPVLAFDTGALPELVTGNAGKVVPYNGDPWKIDPPDIPALAKAAIEIFEDQDKYRHAARALAEKAFGIDAMIDGYLEALGN